MTTSALHPLLDHGIKPGSGAFSGGTLVCHCAERSVKVAISGDIAHNHACGCTRCWKPKGAIFAVVGVVPKSNVSVRDNGDKLKIVDETMTIQRHACQVCGVLLYGSIENTKHAFFGLDFVHAKLFGEKGAAAPGFGAFVSSVIEGGVDPTDMAGIRARLRELGLEPYDCLSPALMDAISFNTWKLKQVA